MDTHNLIGITERGDPCFDESWIWWVNECRPAVLITKNPGVIFHTLQKLRHRNVIVHATITGYGGKRLEPNVVSPEVAFAGYFKLIDLLGEARVVLRVDPVVPNAAGSWVAQKIIEQAKTRVRISFLDNYEHVRERFIRDDMPPLPYDFHAPYYIRHHIWSELGSPEICAEPDFPSTGCISKVDCEILGVEPIDREFKQRSNCCCLGNKHELLKSRKQCKHGCLYCYWKD